MYLISYFSQKLSVAIFKTNHKSEKNQVKYIFLKIREYWPNSMKTKFLPHIFVNFNNMIGGLEVKHHNTSPDSPLITLCCSGKEKKNPYMSILFCFFPVTNPTL